MIKLIYYVKLGIMRWCVIDKFENTKLIKHIIINI